VVGVRARQLLLAALLGALLVPATADARRRVPNTFPFSPPKQLRTPHGFDRLVPFWRDGLPCSTGCRPAGALNGWPVRPFHRAHLLRAGLDELRPANFHLGVDVFARDGTPVYAMQPGRAHIVEAHGRDARVRVGAYEYWHISPRVAEGQSVGAYRDVVGVILRGTSHVHVSELAGDEYINPLRPGGRVLSPWRDRARPVLGRPRFGPRGTVLIGGFDPQGRRRKPKRVPVLGLAALAYRVFGEGRRPLGPLRWAFRGSRHLPATMRRLVYGPGSHPAFAQCARRRRHPCRPNWVYRLAGGLAPSLRSLPSGRIFTLTAYAWDWAGNVSALDTRMVLVRGEPFVSPKR
jgi:hypothetical protein